MHSWVSHFIWSYGLCRYVQVFVMYVCVCMYICTWLYCTNVVMCVYFMFIYHNLENFRVTKVLWEYYLKCFSFVKQAPYKIILTWIFLDTKFIKLLIKMAMREFECKFCIHGYHMYKDIWSPTVSENLLARRWIQLTFAVAVLKYDIIISHLNSKGFIMNISVPCL